MMIAVGAHLRQVGTMFIWRLMQQQQLL